MKYNFILKKIYPSLMLMIFFVVLFIGTGKSFSDNSNIPNIIKIAQISDVHVDSKGKDKTSRMYGSSFKLLKDAVSQINADNKVDTVVFSGDLVNRPSASDLYKFIGIANTLKTPWFATCGNHDIGILGGMSKTKFFEILKEFIPDIKTDKTYYAIEPKKGYLLVFLDGVIIDKNITANGYFPKEELNWLDEELQANQDKKVIIVQHFPVVEPVHSVTHEVLNKKEYLEVIDKHKNVVAVLSGHYHKSKITKRNNVVHISSPALVQYPNAFREIEITTVNNKVKINADIVQTNLKDIQAKSLSRVSSKSKAVYGIKDCDLHYSTTIN